LRHDDSSPKANDRQEKYLDDVYSLHYADSLSFCKGTTFWRIMNRE
jgi:hypothetical protein